jgi:hypothetical protein
LLCILHSPGDVIKAARSFSAPSSQAMLAFSMLTCNGALEPNAVSEFTSAIMGLVASLPDVEQSDVIRVPIFPRNELSAATTPENPDHNDTASDNQCSSERNSSESDDSDFENTKSIKSRVQKERASAQSGSCTSVLNRDASKTKAFIDGLRLLLSL